VTDEEPVTVPNVFQIKLVVCGIDIKGPIEAETGLSVPQARQHFVVNIHVRPRLGTRTELVAGVEELVTRASPTSP